MFLLMSVILLMGWGVLSQHALQVVSQHALQQVSGGLQSQHALQVVSQHALQQVSGGCLIWGVPAPGGGVHAPGGCGLLLWPSALVAFCFGTFWFGGLLVESGLLLWPSGVIFCYGLLVWPSGKAFWYLGVSPNRDPFQPEGHNRRSYQNGFLVRLSGVMFCYGLLVWPSIPLPPEKMATVADGMHPTGMHSCF